jgi:outer membrane protein, heavy metal efflux system
MRIEDKGGSLARLPRPSSPGVSRAREVEEPMATISTTAAFLTGALAVGRLAAAQPTAPEAAASAALEPSGDAALDALVAEALERNPDLAVLQEAVLAARARPDQARALADPTLAVLYTNDGWSPSLGSREMTTLAFMGSQDLPYPGKRRLRGELAARDADQVEQQLVRARLSLAAAVKRAYFGLVLSRERLSLVKEQEALWKQIEGVARARYAVGQGAQPDVLRVQIEVTRIEEQRAAELAEGAIRQAELDRLLDRPADATVTTGEPLRLRSAPEDLASAVERLAARSPELRSAALALERARLRVELSGKDFKPDFSVQAGYMSRGGLDPMWQAGVSFSLPLARKRLAGAQAEAEAQSRASARAADSLRLQLRYRTAERLAQLAATETIARLYDEGVIPQGRMSVDAAVANYQSGKVPFIAVLEALTSLYNDRATHLGLLASHEGIRASLEEASLEETSSFGSAGQGMAARGGAPGDAGMASGRSMR